MRVPLGMPSDNCAAARSAAAEINNCSLAVRMGAVERAVVQPISSPAPSRAAEKTRIVRIPLFKAGLPSGKPYFSFKLLQCGGTRGVTAMSLNETSPARLPTGLAPFSLSDIRPDTLYGLSPIVPFKL